MNTNLSFFCQLSRSPLLFYTQVGLLGFYISPGWRASDRSNTLAYLSKEQGDQKIKKNRQIFQKIAQKVAKSKKGQKYLQQSLIWKPKASTTNDFETWKIAQLAKNRPIWSPCQGVTSEENSQVFRFRIELAWYLPWVEY